MFDLFKKPDPEVERVVEKLLEKLMNIDDWQPTGSNLDVCHKRYNIVANKYRIDAPSHVWIPFRWRKRIRHQIDIIHRIAEVDRLHFIHDVINGDYPLQLRHVNSEQKEWLEENSTGDNQYMDWNYWLYISDEALAVAFKLRW